MKHFRGQRSAEGVKADRLSLVSLPPCRLVMPLMQGLMMLLPPVQLLWRSLMDLFVTPLFQSMAKVMSSIQVKVTDG